MRFKLLRRRLTISAPRMAVRSALPWPFRWAIVAIVLGFCGAISLWAFELGKSLAGIDSGAKDELVRLRTELGALRSDRDKSQSIVNTSASLLTAEKATQERLVTQIRTLEQENRGLRDDLAFFQKLIPAGGGEGIAIRSVQAEVVGGMQLRWQVLVINPVKNAPEFRGQLQLAIAGTRAGQPWKMDLPGGPQALQLRQYRRVDGVVDLPPEVVVKNVSAKVIDGTATRAVQTIQLPT